MTEQAKNRIIGALDEAIEEGQKALCADSAPFTQTMADLAARGHGIIGSLGSAIDAQHWHSALDTAMRIIQARAAVASIIGTLNGIRSVVNGDLLTSIESRMLAEAQGDLLDQAKELFVSGYFLGAGALGRAVLESHLRKWCEREQCAPTPSNGRRPTLNNFKATLYAKKVITDAEQKHVDAMAAVGNLAAHAKKEELKQEQVAWLLENVTAFVANHPLP